MTVVVAIDRATEADIDVISEILGEIEAYYGGAVTPGNVNQIRAALFTQQPAATVLLARDGNHVLSLASYSLLWPAAGADTSLYLKELYVREPARRRGIARQLMARLKEEAATAGCSRIEWTGDTENPPALHFYEAYGVAPKNDNVFYRMEL
ncbi:GNAT family N-acetyltransferase [Streptomyces violascens]|uniref:GNAT family N-acetyltransferase n=1 Tax=Streptomyces violascens TaxID=67381 RepID=UPI003660E21D